MDELVGILGNVTAAKRKLEVEELNQDIGFKSYIDEENLNILNEIEDQAYQIVLESDSMKIEEFESVEAIYEETANSVNYVQRILDNAERAKENLPTDSLEYEMMERIEYDAEEYIRQINQRMGLC